MFKYIIGYKVTDVINSSYSASLKNNNMATDPPFRSDTQHDLHREYVYSAVVYHKYQTRLRELIIFEPWRENYHFPQPS